MNVTIAEFQELVWEHYREHKRQLPWRLPDKNGKFDPYKIMVSEIMLQQTQAVRVIPKYESFLHQFPSIDGLAQAPQAEVLNSWSGLGYNRRAKYLWETAKVITTEHKGVFPSTTEKLIALPGIGHNTAAAILAYAYNQPVVFIETNIRTVFIYHFFPGQDMVSDTEITPLVTTALDSDHPREWYWALMDYGVHIKSTAGNAARNSKHYKKQSPFKGSRREIRGKILRILSQGPASLQKLSTDIADDRLPEVVIDLLSEGLIHRTDDTLRL